MIQTPQNHLTKTLLKITFNYIAYFPLTYCVLYCFTLLLILMVDTSAFFKVILFTLNISGGADATLDSTDILKVFTIWWLILGTFLQLLERFFKVKLQKLIWLIYLLVIVGTMTTIIKTQSVLVPVILLLVFIVSMNIYKFLARQTQFISQVLK